MTIADQPREINLSRQELYERVWSTPMQKLAKEYGLSDVGLAKLCKRYEIPRPERGYWAKKAFGKQVQQPSLPAMEDPSLQSIHFLQGSDPIDDIVSTPRYFNPELGSRIESEVDPVNRIQVKDTLHSPHPLVQKTKDALLSSRGDQYGLSASWAENALRVNVAKANINRALRILDAFIKALETRGFSVRRGQSYYRKEICITGFGQELEFRLREKLKQQPHVLTNEERENQKRYKHLYSSTPKYDYLPTGKFELKVRSFSVQDNEKKVVEDQLNMLMVKIYEEIDHWQRADAQRKQEEELQRRLEEKRQEIERRKKEEQQRLDALVQEANAWSIAKLIRSYVYEVAGAELRSDDLPTDDWATWALSQADRIDPLSRRSSSVRKPR